MARYTRELEKQRDDFITRLRQGKFNESSYDVACETMYFLRRLVGQGRYSDLSDLLSLIKSEGENFVKADPNQFIVGNMVLRVLKLIREDQLGADDVAHEPDTMDSFERLWKKYSNTTAACSGKELKSDVILIINEFIIELETCRDNIAAQSSDHIQEGDVVLTMGNSRTVEAFLKAAGKKCSFSVMIAENAPVYSGHLLMERLKEAKMERVTLINDATVFAKMPKVTKVVLGAFAVLADGGCIRASGTLALALAAKRYSVPVIVLAPFYKLTPRFLSPFDQENFNSLLSPRAVLPFTEVEALSRSEVINAAFDFIPPELVSLYITHTSGNSPSYVYRILHEQYFPGDITSMC